MSRIRMMTATLVAVAAAAGAGCSRTHADQEARAGARLPVAVEVAPVTTARWAQGVEVTGSLAPRRAADVKSEYSGTVAEVLVTEWDPVRRGATLARLDARDAEAMLASAQASRLQAEVAETRAVREFERSVRLRAAGLATQQTLDDARTAREAAGAATAAARAQLDAARTRLDKTVIRAPLDGVVAFRGVDVGDYVESMGAATRCSASSTTGCSISR
ncbi:MAG: efflux RND transporter periplasmic adaptor subunit [Candidatus Krumholzibacteriia bacterium]